jgi:TIGR03009 family protein
MESTQMKIWKRWGESLVVVGLACSTTNTLFAQQGYNTSGANPPRGNQQGSQLNTSQPNAAQPGFSPGAPQGAFNPNAPRTNTPAGINPNLNPGLQRPVSQIGQEPTNTVVTRDPYSDSPKSPEEEKYLDQLLAVWEQNTKDIERLSCEFRMYEYNSNANFVEQLAQQTGKNIREIKAKAASGVVRYMKPDKGMYRIDQVIALTGKLDANNQPEMKASDNLVGDYWICDGETVHSYERKEKKVTHYVIPKEMQGIGILESPMPFLFGVEAKKLKERYWLRALNPPPLPNGQPNKDLFLIEAYPKFQQDAVNYDHVHVFLDRQEFLPLALIKYDTDHVDEKDKPLVDKREYYEFVTREKNAGIFKKLSEKIWNQEFIPVKLPTGWTEETKEYTPAATDQLKAGGNVFPPQGIPANAPFNQPQGSQPPGTLSSFPNLQNPKAPQYGTNPPGNGQLNSAAIPPNNGLRPR